MSGDEATSLFKTHLRLRRGLCELTWRFSKCREQREDMLQEAWAAIAESEAGRADEYYSWVGYKAIEAYYKREYRYRCRQEPSRFVIYRRRRFFIKRAQKEALGVN